ncbi:transcription termination/antitermination protein NusA [Candidatus Falkowbacteria bacterium CG10_big_fil_rev_8_21_14_0_10_39_9]|uniref:Transcription termination/antitermination protein NusA n=1 Tax=Candidatus Falkowbacteria bacterium CG10_big_fil_rev_8_21_14_0_10_39_9 TaxID=1974566 RepID=A0A2M6WR30_9BACT|nr:MAG: transcription termination/antitermination protein NusA [Candidatus Falkowbacteria bacterium CG10_big_fil_rev_8_21_14_0_10_39_9]
MSEITNAIKQICEEKKLEFEAVVSTIELALAAAYRKDFGQKNQNIKVKFNPETAHSKIYDVKMVVEDLPEEELAALEAEIASRDLPKGVEHETRYERFEVDEDKKRFNPKTEIQLKDALLIESDAKIGDEIVMELPEPEDYGRMAAQTAKQVIIQKLREVERDMVFNEFKDKEHEVVTGIIQRQEGRLVFVDLGKAIGILPMEEQVPGESYPINGRVKVYVKEVRAGQKGAEIILSRRSEEILKKVFYLEIPEISNGLIKIESVAREAGSRSKVAISTDSENIDPVGSCVGQRGSRIQTIISELGGEKVDIIEYDEDPVKYISNALSPAKIMGITLNPIDRRAVVKVSPDKLSLAIGKSGQNVRLAAKLTNWKIDIIPYDAEAEAKAEEAKVEAAKKEAKPKKEKAKKPEKVAKEVKVVKKEKKEVKPKKEKPEKKAVKEVKVKKVVSKTAKTKKDKK